MVEEMEGRLRYSPKGALARRNFFYVSFVLHTNRYLPKHRKSSQKILRWMLQEVLPCSSWGINH